MRIKVYGADCNPFVDPPFLNVNPQKAKQLVWQGVARWIADPNPYYKSDGRCLKMTCYKQREESYQGVVYELSGIEKHPHIVSGGLTRNEHMPRKFNKFNGARVGHQ